MRLWAVPKTQLLVLLGRRKRVSMLLLTRQRTHSRSRLSSRGAFRAQAVHTRGT